MKEKVKHVVKPIEGMPHQYIVVSSDGVTEYRVNLIDRGGRGSCECRGFKYHVEQSRRKQSCSHIDDAREYEFSLPGFEPAQLRNDHASRPENIQQPATVCPVPAFP